MATGKVIHFPFPEELNFERELERALLYDRLSALIMCGLFIFGAVCAMYLPVYLIGHG